MSTDKLFSLEGKGLKLTTAEDIEPHIKALKENDAVEEVRFLGNTLGIEACEALAKVLETKKSLKVRCCSLRLFMDMRKIDTRPGRKLRRHLHRPSPLRDPASAPTPRKRLPHITEPSDRRPLR